MEYIYNIIIFSIISLFAFTLRFIFSLIESSDDYWHIKRLFEYKKLKINKSPTTIKVSNSMLGGLFVYPSLPHVFATAISKDKRDAILKSKILNIFYDIFSSYIFFFGAYYLLNKHYKINNSLELSLYAMILYTTTPLLFPTSARLKAAGGRTMGLMWFNAYYILYIFGLETGSMIFYGLMIIPVIGIIMSSEFMHQLIIGFSVAISILTSNLLPIYVLLTSYIVSLFLDFNSTKNILIYQLSHYKWYLRAHAGTTIEARNKIKDFASIPKYIINKNIKELSTLVFYKNSILILLYSFPIFFVTIYFLFEYRNVNDYMTLFLIKSMLAFFILFLLTSLKKFLFLGQAERYMEGALFPVNILFIYFVYIHNVNVGKIVVFAIAYHVSLILTTFILMKFSDYKKSLNKDLDKSTKDVLNFLKSLKNKKIMPIPVKNGFLFSSYDESNKYYMNFQILNDGFNYMLKDQKIYDYPKEHLEEFVDKYGVDMFIFQRSSLKAKVRYPLEKMNILFQNDKYIVAAYE